MHLLKRFSQKDSGIVKTYKNYRKVGMVLHDKIMESCLDQQTTQAAAKSLNILQGNTLTLESEAEGAAFMDFMIHEYRVAGKTAVDTYVDRTENLSEAERELLTAWSNAYTSLFKVTSTEKSESTLALTDTLNHQPEIRLMDISMSQTASPGMLIFLRLVGLKEFNMTSGNTFAFPEHSENFLRKRYKTLAKKVNASDESMQRFIAFFKLNRAEGEGIVYR
jgi:hypothetical protein